MAITQLAAVLQTATFIQGDARDPIGVWGGRNIITGDATGDFVSTVFFVPAERKAAYVYFCYGAQVSKLGGVAARNPIKCRLLTNWPNMDPITGVQGFATHKVVLMEGSASFVPPEYGPAGDLLNNFDRFIPLFDPRPIGLDMNIVELTYENNVLADLYSFETYGYFYDRAVMDAPGGPRHPGSN